MSNFLLNLGAAVQGNEDYADRQQKRAAFQEQMDFDKLRAQAYQQEMARQAAEQKRQEDIARGYVGQFQQPPMPGQPSQPMIPPRGPDAAYRPLPQGQAGPVLPPYRSMNQVPPQQGTPQIPEPPKYDLETAVKKIQATGVTDPQAIMAILEKNQARLDVESRQRLALIKEQEMENYRREQLELRKKQVDNQGRNIDSMIDKRGKPGQGEGGVAKDDGIEAAAWDRIISGHAPPARGGVYQKVMAKVAEIAKENGMTTQELLSASADVKTKLAAKRNFEQRAQNMERAENQLESEIPVFEDLVKKVNTFSNPAMAKMALSARRAMGDPDVTQMDQAAEVIFREFEGIATGNPGTLNVQDVQNAQHSYDNAQTPQQAAAAITGMRRIIKNAQAAMAKTRTQIMDGITSEVSGKGGAPKVGAVQDGYKFKGGNPADPNSWEKM